VCGVQRESGRQIGGANDSPSVPIVALYDKYVGFNAEKVFALAIFVVQKYEKSPQKWKWIEISFGDFFLESNIWASDKNFLKARKILKNFWNENNIYFYTCFIMRFTEGCDVSRVAKLQQRIKKKYSK